MPYLFALRLVSRDQRRPCSLSLSLGPQLSSGLLTEDENTVVAKA